MSNSTFMGNLHDVDGDIYVKASGYSSGTPPANKPYGLSNTKNTSAKTQQSSNGGNWSNYLSSIPSNQNTIFGYAPWQGGGFGVNRWEKSMNKKAVGQYKGKYTKSEAAAVINGDIADKIFDNMTKVGEKESSNFITKTVDEYLDAKYGSQKAEPEAEKPVTSEVKETATSVNDGDTDEDTVTFSIAQDGKGFGQRLLDLGLATDHGLWGADGDVEFYTKQLYEQGALDSRGNLKIGVPIKLKRRKNKGQ